MCVECHRIIWTISADLLSCRGYDDLDRNSVLQNCLCDRPISPKIDKIPFILIEFMWWSHLSITIIRTLP